MAHSLIFVREYHAGIKKDLQKAKDGEGYNPNGVGNAYSHNFLNQKPWHPVRSTTGLSPAHSPATCEAVVRSVQPLKTLQSLLVEFLFYPAP